MKVRIKFAKYGSLRFIGHLDVMRFFQKANRRANIDVAYSTGFSPHQIMSFAQPLGLGLESTGEYMDMEVNSLTSSREMKDALNAQMVEGIEVLDVKLLPENAGNAMASVAAAKYTIHFRKGMEPEFDYISALPDFYAQDEIIVTKKTKKSESTFDMKPSIYELYIGEDKESIVMLVDSSSAGNIKPQLVLDAFYHMHGKTLDDYALLITRDETYTDIGSDTKRKLVPLACIGEDF